MAKDDTQNPDTPSEDVRDTPLEDIEAADQEAPPTEDPTEEADADDDEASVAVDALTGEVVEASDDDDDGPEGSALDPDASPSRVGMSPELEMDPYGEEQLDISRDTFSAMLGEFEEDFQNIREGEIVEASVLKVTETAVILEFGFKSEGSVPLDEFKEAPEEGDLVEVLLESLEDDDGIVVLSKKKADFLRVWEKIKEAHEDDRPVEGTLSRKIKGGVTVDLMGVDAFLPGSQIALRRVPNIEDLIGETYHFKIIKLNKRRRNIVVSRRVILEGEREKKREVLVKELLVGQVREGQVKNITDFGAFIDLGGLDGLLHITDMSWGRVGHPSEVVDIASQLDVKVLDIDWDRERISLGLKQLLPYPWTDIDKKYPVGSRVKGKVVSITNYGAFVELEKGVEGLVHISEMSWTRNVRHPSKLVSIGDEIEAVVLKVDPDDEKISLGMKQIEEDPWLALPVKYPTGTTLTGTVRNLTSFGAFVEIEPGIDGLVHVSDMSWTKRVEHPSEIVQKSDEVEVMVLDVDAENKRISLGLKQLQDDPWPGISERFAPGVEWHGNVARVQDKGVVVDLGDDIEGFVPASHSGVEDADRLDEYYRAGEPVDLRVLESDATNRRIVLEVTELPERKPVEREPVPSSEDGEGEEPEAETGDAVQDVGGDAEGEIEATAPEVEDEDDAVAPTESEEEEEATEEQDQDEPKEDEEVASDEAAEAAPEPEEVEVEEEEPEPADEDEDGEGEEVSEASGDDDVESETEDMEEEKEKA